MNRVKSAAFFLCLMTTLPVSAQTSVPYEGVPGWVETRDARMQWFRQARFGMFIHWGLYSAAAGSWDGKQYPQHYAEWIQNWAKVPSGDYARVLKPQFTAAKFDADAWATLARDAGMKYVIVTSRHHDGFSLFNSKQPYSLDNPVTGGTNISPPGRDLYGEIVTAFRKAGLKVGAYYSLLDWQHPDSYQAPGFNRLPSGTEPNHEVYLQYLHGQVAELVNNYGGLDVFWSDFSSAKHQGESWHAKRLLTDLIRAQPDILVNNRLWDGVENRNGDIATPEKYVPPTGLPGLDWEVSHTMNESYGYSAHDTHWKSYDKMMRLFVETVSKGGNFLLNIGPDAEGVIPQPGVDLLRQIGQWMQVNGEAIHGTNASPFKALDWGYATQKPGRLYLHVFDLPRDGQLELPLKSPVQAAYLLADHAQELQVQAVGERKRIALPASFNGKLPMVVALEIAGTPEVVGNLIRSQGNGEFTLTADSATLVGNTIRVVGAQTADPNRPNALGNWSDLRDYATWDMAVGRPGKYKVLVTYRPRRGQAGKVAIMLGQGKVERALPAGKKEDAKDFSEVDAGILDIPASTGDATTQVKLKAVAVEGKQLPEISRLQLVPLPN